MHIFCSSIYCIVLYIIFDIIRLLSQVTLFEPMITVLASLEAVKAICEHNSDVTFGWHYGELSKTQKNFANLHIQL